MALGTGAVSKLVTLFGAAGLGFVANSFMASGAQPNVPVTPLNPVTSTGEVRLPALPAVETKAVVMIGAANAAQFNGKAVNDRTVCDMVNAARAAAATSATNENCADRALERDKALLEMGAFLGLDKMAKASPGDFTLIATMADKRATLEYLYKSGLSLPNADDYANGLLLDLIKNERSSVLGTNVIHPMMMDLALLRFYNEDGSLKENYKRSVVVKTSPNSKSTTLPVTPLNPVTADGEVTWPTLADAEIMGLFRTGVQNEAQFRTDGSVNANLVCDMVKKNAVANQNSTAKPGAREFETCSNRALIYDEAMIRAGALMGKERMSNAVFSDFIIMGELAQLRAHYHYLHSNGFKMPPYEAMAGGLEGVLNRNYKNTTIPREFWQDMARELVLKHIYNSDQSARAQLVSPVQAPSPA